MQGFIPEIPISRRLPAFCLSKQGVRDPQSARTRTEAPNIHPKRSWEIRFFRLNSVTSLSGPERSTVPVEKFSTRTRKAKR